MEGTKTEPTFAVFLQRDALGRNQGRQVSTLDLLDLSHRRLAAALLLRWPTVPGYYPLDPGCFARNL
jgi:hypothetical protein